MSAPAAARAAVREHWPGRFFVPPHALASGARAPVFGPPLVRQVGCRGAHVERLAVDEDRLRVAALPVRVPGGGAGAEGHVVDVG